MTTRRGTLLERMILGYIIVGAAAVYLAVLVAPIALIAYILGALR
jgi:hypothetical protein